MTLRLNGTTGYVELEAPATAGSNTLVLPTGNGSNGQYLQTNGSGALSWATVSTSNLTRGTAVASTSGTSIDFTGIPSGALKIIILLDEVSTNGTSNLLIQIGDSGGIETTGYVSQSAQTFTANGNYTSSTAGFVSAWGSTAGDRKGEITLYCISGNKWVAAGNHTGKDGVNEGNVLIGGVKTLSDTLTQVRITTVNGTDAFDAGTINIMYEV